MPVVDVCIPFPRQRTCIRRHVIGNRIHMPLLIDSKLSKHQSNRCWFARCLREPNCKLRSLNVSKCLLGGLDAGCLGETIRRARNLDALRAAGASRPADVMPLVLALTEAPCLQLLDLASPRLALDDHPSRLLCHALARNTTLKLLSLEGWTFRIEVSPPLRVFSSMQQSPGNRPLFLLYSQQLKLPVFLTINAVCI